MDVLAFAFNQVVDLYTFVVIVTVVLSWLIPMNVVNRSNRIVDAIWRTCLALTEPLLRPIRSALPNLGGIDISPIILLIAISTFRYAMNRYVFA